MDFSLQASDDPLGLAGGAIQLDDVSSQDVQDYYEKIGDNAKYITNAVKALRPRQEGSSTYTLLDGAALVLALGAAVNTNYIITGASGSGSHDGRPTVTVNWMKPSAIAKLRPYPSAISLTLNGGFGVVDLFGASLPVGAAPISADWSIEMQQGDAGVGTDADYIDDGLFWYGFKKVINLSGYGVVTLPAGATETSRDDGTTRSVEGWRVYSAAWWEYMDATTLV